MHIIDDRGAILWKPCAGYRVSESKFDGPETGPAGTDPIGDALDFENKI